ncbi:Gfo/Idh/MocA family oxidoreductase [Coraliomargarita sp. SDUM461004]|uniref:Gfo/Idh/MocA family oxidoreductase n=1 Tax=Thalassobacterium sedimentorum TaxID=3041258 RepID=A0ABU1AR33_9BACT|nr:Gfo/Idh/MocA family oxidoreductase [Coraliomargarita sp. SDUM461004]MDQ8196345.1 Gfo/Idh/MocA family oxidoreductase [Coraliomargarita sp. SDUM461004]
MTNANDGMNYAPTAAKPQPVVNPGQFSFAAAHFDHGHIYGMINGLTEAGAELTMIYEPDATRIESLKEKFPSVHIAASFEEVLASDVHLVAAAAIPNQRGPIGCQVMQAGKDYFTDKCPFTSLEQLAEAEKVVAATGQKYMVYYSERVHVESAWYADQLIQDGVIGDIVHMEIFGPHRLSKAGRPGWFFDKAQYGGILTDIASHQFDQFLHYTRCTKGSIAHAAVDNRANADKPGLEDVGQAVMILENGVQCFSRVNWFTPDGMRGWGDGRSFITGTKGTIEIRKYFDFGRSNDSDTIILANNEGEQVMQVKGQVGFPFFGQLILDCLNRTENAMTQEHAFAASRLSLQAQAVADQAR